MHDMLVTLSRSPFVVAGEMLRKHPRLTFAALIVVISVLVVLSNVDYPMIFEALELK